MSFIKTDYSKNEESNFEPLPSDNYEMIIQSAQERATKNGAESLQLKLVVRMIWMVLVIIKRSITIELYSWITGSEKPPINMICKDFNIF